MPNTACIGGHQPKILAYQPIMRGSQSCKALGQSPSLALALAGVQWGVYVTQDIVCLQMIIPSILQQSNIIYHNDRKNLIYLFIMSIQYQTLRVYMAARG